MSDNRAFMDRLEDFDETTDEGFAACARVLCEGLNFYKIGILNAVNAAPGVDRPIVVAALKVIYEGILSADADLREAVEAIFELPIGSITYAEPKKRGGDGNGV